MASMRLIAMGLVLVAYSVRLGGVDLAADPVGWLLAYAGVSNLADDVPRRRVLRILAAVAGVVSVPLWFTNVVQRILDVDPSFFWAVSLPQLVFCLVLAWTLAQRAQRFSDRSGAAWFGFAAVLLVAAIVLPPVVFGGGVEWAEEATYAVAALGLAVLAVLLIAFSWRDWRLDRVHEPDPHT